MPVEIQSEQRLLDIARDVAKRMIEVYGPVRALKFAIYNRRTEYGGAHNLPHWENVERMIRQKIAGQKMI